MWRMCIPASVCVCDDQRTTNRILFPPFHMWVSEVDLGSPDLITSTFLYQSILVAQMILFNKSGMIAFFILIILCMELIAKA